MNISVIIYTARSKLKATKLLNYVKSSCQFNLLSILELNTRKKGAVAAHDSSSESKPLIEQDSATRVGWGIAFPKGVRLIQV